MLRYILFDLDNTLYDASSGLLDAIGARINAYMTDRLGIAPEQVSATRVSYLDAFGTTLNALRHYYRIDADQFLEFVHDLPLSRYIGPDPALDGMLARLPLRKVILTNSDLPHAGRVLSTLGIAHHFERVIDIRALEFVNKPEPGAYERALRMIDARADECVFVEDSLPNLLAARRMGMITVLVRDSGGGDGAHYHISRITDLDRVLKLATSAER